VGNIKYSFGIPSIPEVEVIISKFYGRHHDLVNCYGISVWQITTDMFHLP